MKRQTHLQLLDNYPYVAYSPPVVSVLGGELGQRMVAILERLNFGDARRLYDELVCIAKTIHYPLNRQIKCRDSFGTGWITEEDYDCLDWLLSKTIDHAEYNKTMVACIVASLYWSLARVDMDMDLSPFLKSLGLNTAFAGFLVSHYLEIFKA